MGEESCVGIHNTRDLVGKGGKKLDKMLKVMVDRYMQIDCVCFTLNRTQLYHIMKMTRDIDGVIHYGLSYCQPYAMEAFRVEKELRSAGIPILSIETGYGMEDMEQLKNMPRGHS